MKKLFILSFAVLISLFTSCSSDDNNSAEDLIGEWQFVTSKENGIENNITTCDTAETITFTDKLVIQSYYTEDNNGDCIEDGSDTDNYTASGNELIIVLTDDNGNTDAETGKFSISGNTLTLTFTEDINGETFTYISTFKKM